MSALRPGLPDPLVNLLGASWAMGAPAGGAAWLDAGGVAFGLADGTLAIARASWEGAATLRPREGGGVELVPASAPPPPVMRMAVHDGPCHGLAADGAGRVLSGGADGRLALIDAAGQVETLARSGSGIGCLAAGHGTWAYAMGQQVHRFTPEMAVLDQAGPVTALAFAPDAGALAIAGPAGVMLWSADGATRLLPCPGTHRALAWSPDGRHLVSGLEGSVHGWRLPDAADIAMGDTAGQAPCLSFSPGGFCAASGWPRVMCWSFEDGSDAARRHECGVGSTVAVSAVACHPARPLIAAGYENGAVLLCQPTGPDILFVRAAGGGSVSHLVWSPDGEHLAFAAAGGAIGVVAFPAQLFRPQLFRPQLFPPQPERAEPVAGERTAR